MVKPLFADDEVAPVTSSSPTTQTTDDTGRVVVDSIGKVSDSCLLYTSPSPRDS